jgi:hypothetical protein
MCASTVLRVVQGLLAAVMLFMAGKEFFAAGLGVEPAMYSLLGAWLGWMAFTGSG